MVAVPSCEESFISWSRQGSIDSDKLAMLKATCHTSQSYSVQGCCFEFMMLMS